MGEGSLSGPQARSEGGGSAKLAAAIAGDVQGIVVSGFNDLPAARALFLDYPDGGGQWLAALRAVAPITAADGKQQPAAMIAFTYPGLSKLGLPQESVSGFQAPFVEGMLQPDRRRRLGDLPGSESAPDPLVWSGNGHLAANLGGGHPTRVEVLAMLVLYHADHGQLGEDVARVKATLADSKVDVVREMVLDLRLDARNIAREHFGFSDGVSQPIPHGDGVASPTTCDPLHGVPLGEILLGYPNAHHEQAQGPIVAEALAPMRHANHEAVKATLGRLGASDKAAGLRDLGRNGSYLVVRELKQDVAGFWAGMAAEARGLGERSGGTETVDQEWLATRVVGRNKDGHLLGPDGALPGLPPNGAPDNDALFFTTDRYGFGCPLGSHVRRANPRDGLAAKPADCEDLLAAANAHRILRRGRKFGSDFSEATKDEERGLLFICLNTDIARQFEFIQQNWLLNPNFATLLGERDPLVGPDGPMTIPREPLRRKVDVQTYVTLTGGDYFFLPSLKALDYFATLTPRVAAETPS